MIVKDLVSALNKLAFTGLAEDWDNVGLQIGDPDAEVSGCLLGIDVTSALIEDAASKGLNVIIAHHPVIFKPLKNVVSGNFTGDLIRKAITNKINIIVMHTNLDSVDWGVSAALADFLGLKNTKPIRKAGHGYLYKLAVFVPKESLDDVRAAVCGAGGGVIGEYRYCTFSTPGQGTFQGSDKTEPYTGKAGQLEKVDELRLEVLVEKNVLSEVLSAMISAHPYEEVAYDLYPLANTKDHGLGKIGAIEEVKTVVEIADMLGLSPLVDKVGIIGDSGREVSRIAVCGGSAGSVLGEAMRSAELLICGELGHHFELEAAESGLSVITLGHAPSEAFVLNELKNRLQSTRKSINIEVYNKLFRGPKWVSYE